MSARLPFGKYKGWALDEVPLAYLAWLHDECDLREPLRSDVFEELVARLDLQPGVPQLAPPPDIADAIADMIVSGYRERSHRLHPDHGGDHRAMQNLNAARDWCRAAGLVGVAVTS